MEQVPVSFNAQRASVLETGRDGPYMHQNNSADSLSAAEQAPPLPKRPLSFAGVPGPRYPSGQVPVQTPGSGPGLAPAPVLTAGSVSSSSQTQTPLAPPPRKPAVDTPEYGSADSTDYEGDSSDRPGLSRSSTTTSVDTSQYPDSSQANRRAPVFSGHMHSITLKPDVAAAAALGPYVCACSSSTAMLYNAATGAKLWTAAVSDGRPTAVAFLADAAPTNDADAGERLAVWVGMRDGQVWEIRGGVVTARRSNVHLTPVRIVHYAAGGAGVWTLSADGKLAVWPSSGGTAGSDINLKGMPHSFRVTPNFSSATVAGETLWVARNKQILVYAPGAAALSPGSPFLLTARPLAALTNTANGQLSELMCATHLPSVPDLVFFGHDDGSVTVFSVSALAPLENVNMSIHGVVAMHGVGSMLWLGLKNGHVQVCDVAARPWVVRKDWKAHAGPAAHIVATTEQNPEAFPVLSWSPTEHSVSIWDGALKNDWIEREMHERAPEFSSLSTITTQVITWNAGAARPDHLARNPADAKFVQSALDVSGGKPADVIVFGFQELVELDNKSVTARSMFKSAKRDQEIPVDVKSAVSQAYKQWQDYLDTEVSRVTGGSHRLVHSMNLVGLFTAVFVHESLIPRLRSLRFAQVKTGLGGLHGNKGGLVVRMLLDDSSLCFVNCHLAAGQSGSAQRNKDIGAILDNQFLDESHNSDFVGKGVFVNGGDGTRILDHELCFFSGDMNYRINMHRQLAIRAIEERNWQRLLSCDQLVLQLRKNASLRLRAFEEPSIAFAPTYKFDVGTDTYDSSDKKRVPAWCDRIFFRGGGYVKPRHYTSLTVRASDHRPVSAVFDVQIKTIDPAKRMKVYRDCVDSWRPHLATGHRASYASLYE